MQFNNLRSVLLQDTTARQLVGGLSVPDALALVPACTASKIGAEKFSAALAFAQTRPVHQRGRPEPGTRPVHEQDCPELELGCSVARWAELWEQCATSVEAQGLDSRAWFRASTRIEFNRNGHAMELLVIAVKQGRQLDRFCEVMLGKRSNVGRSAKVCAVLYVESVSAGYFWLVCDEDDAANTVDNHAVDNVLVALTDGSLAWIVSEYCFTVSGDDYWATYHADLFVAKDLPQLVVNANVSWDIREGRLHGDRGARAAKWAVHLGKVECDHMASQQLEYGSLSMVPQWDGKTLASSILQSADEFLQLELFRRQAESESQSESEPESDGVQVVTEEVTHHDPAAHIDPDVAASQTRADEDEAFAQLVERRVRAATVPPVDLPAVNILTYRSGKGELFRQMLLEGAEFASLRGQLGSRGMRPDLPCGALVLVHPDHYHAVLYSLELRELKRYNLIIAESDEYLLDEVLRRLSSKQRPRENRQERQKVEFMATFVTKRTFLCFIPTLSAASAVTQSTTEAQRSSGASSSDYYAHARGGNPRRRQAW